MRSILHALISVLAILSLVISVHAEDGFLVVHVVNLEDAPLDGVVLSIKGKGTESEPTASGATRLKLPNDVKPSSEISLQLLRGPDEEEWVLISPWDGRVIVPPFDDKSYVSIWLGKKGDKQLLSSGKALSTITATILKELSPKSAGEGITEEQRRKVLDEQGKAYGLNPDDVDKAIRDWSEHTNDPYEKGLAALYEKNYPEATKQLSESLEMREREMETAKGKVADAAFFLGNSLFEQGKYPESVNAYKKAYAQRPDETTIMNNLGVALVKSGSYSEAEPLYKRALEISEKALGKDHPDVATTLNNLAGLYDSQGRYSEAEPLYKRALQILEKAFGNQHPYVATVLENYADLLKKTNREKEAEAMEARAKAIREKHKQANQKK